MESRFNYIYIYIYIYIFIYFGCVSLSGDMSCVEWIGHEPSLFFAQSDLCSR